MSPALGARLATIAVGCWLMAAPAVLEYTGTSMADSDRIVGPIAGSLALVACWAVLDALRWGTLPCGAWAIVAPWLLSADVGAMLSSMLAGVIMVVLAPIGRAGPEEFGGGWRSVRPAAWRVPSSEPGR